MIHDILCDILSHLPAECVLRFRIVCKSWQVIIDNPFFVKFYTQKNQHMTSTILVRHSVGGGLCSFSLDCLTYDDGCQEIHDVTPIKQIIQRGVPRLGDLPVPSCNGLILISHHCTTKSWVIWNPLVQDFHVLPPPSFPDNDYTLRSCGFGYDESADDYRVVRVDRVMTLGELCTSTTHVYSLKSRCWRAIDDFPGEDCLGSYGVFLKGWLHWRSRGGIIALHVGRENHVVMPRPPGHAGPCWEALDALDGCLIFSCGHRNLMGMDGWVMNEGESSWSKLFSIRSDVSSLRVVAYLKREGQIFINHNSGGDDGGLVWVDLETNSAKRIAIHGLGLPNKHLTFSQFTPGSILRLDNSRSKRAHARYSLMVSLTSITTSSEDEDEDEDED